MKTSKDTTKKIDLSTFYALAIFAGMIAVCFKFFI